MSSIAHNQQIEGHFVQILAYIRLKGHKPFLLLYAFIEKSIKNMANCHIFTNSQTLLIYY
jgi:hypothetical protein